MFRNDKIALSRNQYLLFLEIIENHNQIINEQKKGCQDSCNNKVLA